MRCKAAWRTVFLLGAVRMRLEKLNHHVQLRPRHGRPVQRERANTSRLFGSAPSVTSSKEGALPPPNAAQKRAHFEKDGHKSRGQG